MLAVVLERTAIPMHGARISIITYDPRQTGWIRYDSDLNDLLKNPANMACIGYPGPLKMCFVYLLRMSPGLKVGEIRGDFLNSQSNNAKFSGPVVQWIE